MADPVQQYLQRYADPLARDLAIEGRWDQAVVVPLRDESIGFIDGLGELGRLGRLLLIAVVNGVANAPAEVSAANAALLRALVRGEPASLATLVRGETQDRLVIDRATGSRTFTGRDGVGLARKIGLDVALALWQNGQLGSAWLRTTDADATLRVETDAAVAATGAAARVSPFWHVPSGQRAVDRATARYEVWLRYYLAGLAHAGSPWAMPTIGSTIEVSAPAYAAVRGMPRREAGEDFHILAKLAKVGSVLNGGPVVVELRSRASQRVPFGTGPAVLRAMRTDTEPTAYDPVVFDQLGRVVGALDSIGGSGGLELEGDGLSGWAIDVLRDLGLPEVVRGGVRLPDPAARTRRLHEWFDARRTLRFVHGLRDRAHADLSWQEAVARASFVPSLDLDPADDLLIELRTVLAALAPTTAGLGAARAARA